MHKVLSTAAAIALLIGCILFAALMVNAIASL